jgi:hypothetical protein
LNRNKTERKDSINLCTETEQEEQRWQNSNESKTTMAELELEGTMMAAGRVERKTATIEQLNTTLNKLKIISKFRVYENFSSKFQPLFCYSQWCFAGLWCDSRGSCHLATQL